MAEALHKRSQRKNEKLVVVNLSALTENLIESELFGVEKGAFTGAIPREGYLAAANEGTLFLDEIADIAPSIQVKLLRVIEYKTYQKVGSPKEEKVNVRIVCATNKDLREEVERGRFREDLYYRLGCTEIRLPSLKKRGESDFDLLLEHFCRKYEETNGHESGSCAISEPVYKLLKDYSWPGNIREFKLAMETMLTLADNGENFTILEEHVSYHIQNPVNYGSEQDQSLILLKKLISLHPVEISYDRIEEFKQELEYLFLSRLYKHCNKEWSKVAKKCGMGDKDSFRRPEKMNESLKAVYEKIIEEAED